MIVAWQFTAWERANLMIRPVGNGVMAEQQKDNRFTEGRAGGPR